MSVKVLQMVTAFNSVNSLLEDKMLELKEYGYDIEFMSSYPKDVYGEGISTIVTKHGFKHHLVPISRTIEPMKDMESLREIRHFLKGNRYDIVHTRTAKAGFIGRIAARLAKVPVVIHTSHGLPFYLGQSILKYNIYKQLEIIASKFSDAYLSQNYEDLEVIKGIVPDKVLTGYEGNGISEQELLKRVIEKNIIKNYRESLELKEDDFVFLMGARMEPVKNHEMLLESLAKVKNENVKVLLAGDGPLYDKLRQKALMLDVLDKVKFLGYRKDILELIQLSDAVMLTSEKEGIPRIIMESMFFKKPILATDVLGTRELVLDRETGVLIPLNNINELTKSIDKWTSKEYKKTLKMYGIKSEERLLNHFVESKVAERIHNFYQTLI